MFVGYSCVVYALFVVSRLLCVGNCSLLVVRCLFVDVCLFGISSLMVVVCCLLLAVCCLACGVRRFLFVAVCCW